MNDSFNGTVADICQVELKTLLSGYKYSVFDGKTFVLEGHKGIASYSDVCVKFSVKCGAIAVSGNNLKIKCLQSGLAVVQGKICAVEVKS